MTRASTKSHWDAYWQQHGDPHATYDNDDRILTPILALGDVRGKRILEVGAGSGRDSIELARQGAIVTVIDYVPSSLTVVAKNAAQAGVPIQLVCGDGTRMPFPDDTFDCVLCCEVVEHVPRDPSPIAELVRVLRPGGRLVLSTPDYGTPMWPIVEKLYAAAQPKGYADEHITHYTEESLIEEMRGYGLRCVGLNRVYRAIVVGAFE